jgi:sulfate adenylyltransferase subunit 1
MINATLSPNLDAAMAAPDTVHGQNAGAAAPQAVQPDARSALTFITCGSVDDGKSTLIGRLLLDSRALLQDQVASVTRTHATTEAMDLAAVTDGLSAEREQGITIDVAWRYFATSERKFIIGDSPGHEQYTRNMVTAASQADAALVLVDATKLDWQRPGSPLLQQTRRHTLLAKLLRVPTVVFAVNKLDAVADPSLAFAHISAALRAFAQQVGGVSEHTVPISALLGHNVVDPCPGWAGYHGPSLLQLLAAMPTSAHDEVGETHVSVQWVEKQQDSADTEQGRRILWGRVAAGALHVGDAVKVNGAGHAQVAALRTVRGDLRIAVAGTSVGVVLDRELDVCRGDWLVGPERTALSHSALATVAWMDNQPLVPGRTYWALHGHRWVKAKVTRIVHQLDVNTLQTSEAATIPPNAIGDIELRFQSPLPLLPFTQARELGRMILVDAASHATAGAVLIRQALSA